MSLEKKQKWIVLNGLTEPHLLKTTQLWGARYGLGLISIQTGHPQKAVDELRIAMQAKAGRPASPQRSGIGI